AGPRTTGELAAVTGAAPAELEHLLCVRRPTGYVRRDDGRHANTPAPTARLCSESRTHRGGSPGRGQTTVGGRRTGLAGGVRSGIPGGGFYDWLAGRPELSSTFHQMQLGLAEWLAEEVVSLVRVPEGGKSLLDLGGGHGLYAGEFCRAVPGLTGTIVDAAVT